MIHLQHLHQHQVLHLRPSYHHYYYFQLEAAHFIAHQQFLNSIQAIIPPLVDLVDLVMLIQN